MKKSFPYTVSLTKEVAAKWHERARDAKVSRSVYLTLLIEEDYARPRRQLRMVDEELYERFLAAQKDKSQPQEKDEIDTEREALVQMLFTPGISKKETNAAMKAFAEKVRARAMS